MTLKHEIEIIKITLQSIHTYEIKTRFKVV